MNFDLSEDHVLLRDSIAEFAQAQLAPIAARLDDEAEFPHEVWKQMGELGFLGLRVPEAYGGSPVDMMGTVLVGEEIARACAGTALAFGAHAVLCAGNLAEDGSEALKERYLPPLARGEAIGALAITEPDAGSDTAGMKTRARRVGNTWVLDGTKTFITNGSLADVVLVFARTGEEGQRELSCFLVERDTPGYSVSKDFSKMGMRASTLTELSFHECAIPESHIVGEVGQGFRLLMSWLDRERIGFGGLPLGICRAAFDVALEYASQREQFGQPIATFQLVKELIADMATELEAIRWMIYRSAWLHDQGRSSRLPASMGKLMGSEVSMRLTSRAIQVLGGYGYVKEYPVERCLRDAKLLEIGGGTSQIQKLIIAEEIYRNRGQDYRRR